MSSVKAKILWGAQTQAQRLKKLLQAGPLLRGSCSRVLTRCGKLTCWCAQSKKGHPHTRLTWSQQGQMVTRKVPAEAVAQIQKLTRQYRQFRADRRTLLAGHDQIQRLLDRYEQSLISQARRSFRFLSLNSKKRAVFKKTVQNHRRPKMATDPTY